MRSTRAILVWAALAAAIGVPIALAAVSPLLAWREPLYVAAGFAGVVALALMLVQPLLMGGYLPGLPALRGRRAHRWIGGVLVVAVVIHVGGLWITSPPDVIDALLFTSPTPFSAWGVEQSSPNYPYAPTIFGPDKAPTFSYTDEETGIKETYTGPGGIDLEQELGKNWVPVPMANLGFGLPKGTDLKLRFTPTIDLGDDSSLKVFGFGVMHDIKQWIPGIKLLPFDLSGFFGYTRFKMETYFDKDANPDQRGLFEVNATTIQGLISKKFSVLTLYGGVGYNIARSNLAMKGTYDINEDGEVGPNELDPLDLRFSASGFRTTAGMRLKLAVLTLHADYTLQKYKCLTVGLGISVR